jgi:hypothetical protein
LEKNKEMDEIIKEKIQLQEKLKNISNPPEMSTSENESGGFFSL